MSTVMVSVYDLSQGMAAQLSAGFLGKQIDGIWHTGIIVFGREYYFGGGICSDVPGATPYGMALRTEGIGATQKTEAEFMQFLRHISSKFSMATYDLLENNCNNFSDACAMFLVSKHIPQYILDLPNEALDSPMGPMLRGMLQNAQGAIRDQSMGHELQLGPAAGSAPNTYSSSSSASRSKPPSKAGLSKKQRTKSIWKVPEILSRSNRAAVVSKLRELNPSMTGDEGASTLISFAIDQSPETAFPTLDLLRLAAIKSSHECVVVANGLQLLLQKFCADKSPHLRPAYMMSIRCAVNCFAFPQGEKSIYNSDNLDIILEAAVGCLSHPHKSVKIAGSLLLMNLVGAPERYGDDIGKLNIDQTTLIASSLADLFLPEKDIDVPPDVAKYALSSLAVLADADEDCAQIIEVFGIDISRYLKKDSGLDEATIKAARLVSDLVKGLK